MTTINPTNSSVLELTPSVQSQNETTQKVTCVEKTLITLGIVLAAVSIGSAILFTCQAANIVSITCIITSLALVSFGMISIVKKTGQSPTHPFRVEQRKQGAEYRDSFSITTANAGMLPGVINAFQRVGYTCRGLVNSDQPALLSSASSRASVFAERLVKDGAPVICCQEVFDGSASNTIALTLADNGYTVFHRGGGSNIIKANSGLLFASRYPVNLEDVRFWKFTNLRVDDKLSYKGVLRVPLEVPLDDGSTQSVVVYCTHLQAELDKKEIRKEQLEGILSLIKNDQQEHPDASIFFAGDLNISDVECEGALQNEYTENQAFFSQFFDYVDKAYQKDGTKHENYPRSEICDRDREFSIDQSEPVGSFYKMTEFETGAIEKGCFYDRILHFNGGNENRLYPIYDVAIRRLMEKDGISDHLPVTAQIDLNFKASADAKTKTADLK